MAQKAKPTRLGPQTLKAFETYIRKAETEMKQNLEGSDTFLWSDGSSERVQQIQKGRIVAQFWSGQGPIKVPDGLIHDWIGAAFLPAVNLKQTLTLIQDYDHHKNIYKPEVIDSKLISRHDNDFQIYLRILKKKIITVVLDTDHEVHYRPVDSTRWVCCSHTTRVAEVENAGSPKETVLHPDTGYGFLWRLCSFWRFEERDAGVCLECRAISLTRDVPLGLGWIIEPIIQKLPKESLIKTLESTRRGLAAETK
jgi:hypothetical protein